MGKLEVIDGKQTNWGGLWWHPENQYFSSQAISLGQLRRFKGNVRIYVKKNKFFKNGTNGRPNYTFCLRDARSENSQELEVGEIDEDDNKQALIDELKEVMRQGHDGSEYKMLPSESQARASRLEKRAIELVEKLTGEEWEFAYTWIG